jgi:hypothetical protein
MAEAPRLTVRSVADIADVLRGTLAPTGASAGRNGFGPGVLRSGSLAGELFQKVVNYRAKLAIVIRDASRLNLAPQSPIPGLQLITTRAGVRKR